MDIDKQHLNSTDDAREIDDEIAVVIEIPDSDPFYDKKKKLLEDMGFDPLGSVQIKSSSTPDQLKNFLDVLLRMARVKNFSEVELYFSRDVIDLGDYTNPRNELLALHAILESIDKSLSSKINRSKNVLHNLQNSIIDRIHTLGSKFVEETKIVEDSSCDKEQCLLDWTVKNGVKTKLEIAYVEGAGRGAIATEKLEVGDVALEIPVSIIISEDLLHESDLYPILAKIDGISLETMLLLWSMKEKHNKSSRFKLYFDTLPEHFNTGLSFGTNAFMALDGMLLLEEILQAKEHLRTQYDELFPALCNHHPDVFPPELYTWEQFLWACELWYSNSMKVIFGDGKLRTCLIPVAGFLNHSTFPHIMHYGKVDATTNSLSFPLSRTCHAGEQCFLSYGRLSSSHLLTFYGFIPQGDNNPFDVIPLDIDLGEDSDCKASEWGTHMVRGTWLSKNHEIFHYGLPSLLLDHIRKARDPEWWSSGNEILDNELDILRDLTSTFEGMMEGFGDENLDDGERASWDVKLAMEFKNLQRKIVSSILTSCNAGCELIERELKKLAN
ncbi:hypothetical protein ACJIZ3_025628 [Penstemon smallii]|uniref:SET domain-containing protein n=1 Tax=Penstemon smallii TaxID=265156 RepID=A0ABD3TVD6_9LAMI